MIDRYKRMDIMTASPVTLVVKLYEGALKNAYQARLHLEEGRIPERVRAIDKALAIVSELQSTLDLEQGGEIAVNLQDLYGFVNGRLIEANLRASTAPIDEALGVLETLLDAWRQIAQNPASAATAAATP